MITLYNVVSSDGFIAGKDGNEDFIPEEIWEYDMKFFEGFDIWIMGRKTYEAIQDYDEESKQLLDDLKIKKIVLTEDKNFKIKKDFILAHTLQDAISMGKNILVCSGPTLNTSILKEKLADRVIQYRLSVAIGEGIKPFDIETESLFKEISKVKNSLGTIITYEVIK